MFTALRTLGLSWQAFHCNCTWIWGFEGSVSDLWVQWKTFWNVMVMHFLLLAIWSLPSRKVCNRTCQVPCTHRRMLRHPYLWLYLSWCDRTYCSWSLVQVAACGLEARCSRAHHGGLGVACPSWNSHQPTGCTQHHLERKLWRSVIGVSLTGCVSVDKHSTRIVVSQVAKQTPTSCSLNHPNAKLHHRTGDVNACLRQIQEQNKCTLFPRFIHITWKLVPASDISIITSDAICWKTCHTNQLAVSQSLQLWCF